MSVAWVIGLWVYVLGSVILRIAVGRRNPGYYQTSRARWYLATIMIGAVLAVWGTVDLSLTRA